MGCVFCHRDERTYKPAKDVEYFICGTCTRRLVNADQDVIKHGYQLAIEKGYQDKAEALESFIEGENIGEQTNKRRKLRNITKHFDRKGSRRTSGFIKKPALSSKKRKAVTLSQS